MPIARPRPCKQPGCRALVRDRAYCEQHKPKEYERPTAHQRGYGARWQKARAGWLRSYPLCVVCQAEGKLTVATDVDHITPHKGDMVLFWDASNWQSLCRAHHSQKTAREDGGFGLKK